MWSQVDSGVEMQFFTPRKASDLLRFESGLLGHESQFTIRESMVSKKYFETSVPTWLGVRELETATSGGESFDGASGRHSISYISTIIHGSLQALD